MSVRFTYYNTTKTKPRFNYGTSSDIGIFKMNFPDKLVNSDDISKLRAMHSVTGLDSSLWSEIADKLEALQGDTDHMVTLEIDWEF